MQVTEIMLQNFMPYPQVHVSFPTRGIVLITGDNGHGKSALIEGIPAALWNETLRGTPWYNDGLKSVARVIVQADKVLEVIRSRSPKGTWKLKLSGDDRQFDSAAKAKPILNASIGTFDVWRRTHVFSSSDDAHFSRATDGQKKRFLETILGLDKFETALKLCKKELKAKNTLRDTAQNSYSMFDTKATYEASRVAEALRTREGIDETSARPDLDGSSKRLATALKMDKDDLTLLRRASADTLSSRKCGLHAAQKAQEKLLIDQCPWCKQAIPEGMKEDLAKAAEKASEALEEIREEAEQELAILDILIEELEEDISIARTKHACSTTAVQNYDRLKRERVRLNHVVEEATAANAEYLHQRAEKRVELDVCDKDLGVINACEKILGLRGVRANVTSRTLGGLEEIANHWLARFTDGEIQLKINPFRELKSRKGAVNEEWSMELLGAGGGFGYKAGSAGERQRIDVALLFASAEIAQAALGIQNGTMFFDEVFDHLDKPGVLAVVEALEEMATKKTVVVISHSDALVDALRPALHLHVQNGKVITR